MTVASVALVGRPLDPRGPEPEWSAPRRVVAVALMCLLAAVPVALSGRAAGAAEQKPVTIAVFDFELDDRSAGAGVVAEDPFDRENLELSTEEARRLLSASGRYSVVETDSLAGELAAAGGIRRCNGCEAALAERLGADQSMAGLVARVSRTEYTLQVVIRDSRTGEVLLQAFSGLRMGANYAWPRGTRWLMERRILSAGNAE